MVLDLMLSAALLMAAPAPMELRCNTTALRASWCPASEAEIARDPGVREVFRTLVSRTRGGFSHVEDAVFIVRNDRGELTAVEWPSTGDVDGAQWEGAFPAGTIAIAHTHPNWLPMPSRIDARTARVTHLPVYVVTPSRVVKTTGGDGVVVLKGDRR